METSASVYGTSAANYSIPRDLAIFALVIFAFVLVFLVHQLFTLVRFFRRNATSSSERSPACLPRIHSSV